MQLNCSGNNLEVKALCNMAMAEIFAKIKVLFWGGANVSCCKLYNQNYLKLESSGQVYEKNSSRKSVKWEPSCSMRMDRHA
jgi:hypothetical protein